MIFADIKKDVKEILGMCSDDLIYRRATKAIQTLMNKGNWNPLIGIMDICACSDGRTVALPRDVETPLAVNTNGNPGFFRNKWFEFHLNGPGSDRCNQKDNCTWAWDDKGVFPTFMDIIQPSYLTVIAEHKTDLSKKIRIFGKDETGKEIYTQDEDGVYKLGYEPSVNLFSDFPSGLIIPEDTRIFKRKFTAGTIDILTCATNHNFTTGAAVVLSLITAPLPTPLVIGQTYFVRVITPKTVKLYLTRDNALTDFNAVKITFSSTVSEVGLTDRRAFVAQSKINTGTPHLIKTGTQVTFTATTLPVPLSSSTTYFARSLDADDVTIHPTLADANSNLNPINLRTPGASVSMRSKQPLTPITKFNFAVRHNFNTGDIVLASSTGVLPSPLISGAEYFVRVVDSQAVTLHANLADATNNENPVAVSDVGAGTHSLIKTLNATAALGNSSQITSVGHNLLAGSFVSFNTTGSFPAPIAQNTVYKAASPLSANTFTLTDTSDAPVNITTLGSGQLTLVVSRAFTVGFTSEFRTDAELLGTGTVVRFASTGTLPVCNPAISSGTDYFLRKLQDNKVSIFTTLALANDNTARTTVSRSRTSNVATITTAAAHGFAINDVVDIINVQATRDGVLSLVTVSNGGTGHTNGQAVTLTNGAGYQATGSVNVVGGRITTVTVGAGGTGYTNGELVTLTNSGGSTATATLIVSAGVITGFTIVNGGSNFAVSNALTMSGNTTGTGATQTVGAIVNNTIASVSISNGGSSFVLSESLTATGLSGSGQTLSVGAIQNGVPSTPNNYNGERILILSTPTATSFTYNSVGPNEPTVADTGGEIYYSSIKVTNFGTGTLTLDRLFTVAVQNLNSSLISASAEYLTTGAIVKLETDGTLPSPLATGTDYKIVLGSNNLFTLTTTTDTPITLTDIGSGNHSFVISRGFNVNPATFFDCVNNNYENGTGVTLETSGTLPTPLLPSTTYYIRRISDDVVELYGTEAQAENTSSTTGRITPTSQGEGTHKFVQIVPNIKFSEITRIRKDQTDGNFEVYAHDYGRNDNYTKIGLFAPLDIDPAFRRIKVSTCCAWVRVRYRRKSFDIRSDDDWIPLTNPMAILYMIRALKLYDDNFIQEGAQYETLAEKFLTEEHLATSGPDSVSLQMNSDIYSNPDGQWMM